VGCREVCRNGENGFLVKVKDPFSLAQAMIKFLKMPEEERRQMGENGRKMVLEEFDERKVVEKYFELIKEVLGA
jgi:glycosyltransferase involved in cell wall biosynthesis